MEKEFYVIAFESTHYAIMIERKLKEKFKIHTVPTPREITASCGLSIKFDSEYLSKILEELRKENVDYDKMGIYKIKRKGSKKVAEKINWG
ncbi:DUF3343 domain-containing protein [Caminicella sporogenes]|uniref:DUF3343 domain-containing protein n=1 Tax=Caminicella sporogenes TaxID=166485 RepID=UPI00253FE1D6|nr:DUF3343 domain-containing protein [Caminicella sporogenes]WIF95844.1 DUF3343 domain-containing protein [Caminicella sporogenes]